MTQHAHGPFDVSLAPQPADLGGDEVIGRMTIDKQFHGELEATSKGQMLAFRSEVAGSAGYVAMERVVGTLNGRTGTFVLQHSGVMTHGAGDLLITVVPDSGTEELVGLSGSMNVIIKGRDHSYDFEYSLPVPADGRHPQAI
jgi:hypothetical protein